MIGVMHIRYAVKQMLKRPIINAIVVCQFTAVLILSALMIQQLGTYFLASNMIKDICTENSYKMEVNKDYSRWYNDAYDKISQKYNEIIDRLNYMLGNNEIDEQAFEEMYKKQVTDPMRKEASQAGLDDEVYLVDTNKLPYIKNDYVVYGCNICVSSDTSTFENVSLLSRSYANSLNIKPIDGRWLKEEDTDDEYIDLVACSDKQHRVGDIVDLQTVNYTEQSEKDLCKGRIIGIIYNSSNEEDYTKSTSRNDVLSIDDILDFQGVDYYAVYPEDDAVLKSNGEFECEKIHNIVMLNDDITESERREFLSTAAKEHYTANNLKVIYDNTYNMDLKKFKNDIMFLSLAFLIAIVSIVGVSVLNVARERRTYSIYCLSGMTTRDCTLINSIYTLMILFSSCIIAIIVKIVTAYNQYKHMLEVYEQTDIDIDKYVRFEDYFKFQSSYIWLIIGLFAVSFVCSMIVPYFSLKKLDIISEIKQND